MFFDTKWEKILKSLLHHSMLTTLLRSVNLVVQSQFLNSMVEHQFLHTMVGTQLLNTMVGPQLLHIMVGLNWIFFQNLPNSLLIASGHDVIHTPALFPVWYLLWQWWLSYPLHASVNCTKNKIKKRKYKSKLIIKSHWRIGVIFIGFSAGLNYTREFLIGIDCNRIYTGASKAFLS